MGAILFQVSRDGGADAEGTRVSWCEVTFLPAGKVARVRAGSRLLDAAEQGQVKLRHVCGGQANCTTCRVQVQSGTEHLTPLSDKESHRLSDLRLETRWRLACQARVHGAVTVRIPTLIEQLEEARENESR
ncbi:2Fe-2S ferredoxin [bacterium CPR1]|nr:2Fe-2S ferredoxin [bacterium CPR1]